MGRKNIVLKIEDYELLEWSKYELRGYLCGGISVITPLPAGEGTGEGPAEDGGGASCCLLRGHLLSVVSVQVDYLLTLLSLYCVALLILS